MSQRSQRNLAKMAVGALVATVALAGCSKTDQREAKNDGRDSATSAQQKAKELGNDTAAANAKTGDKIDDARITAGVKTELAKDSTLSALKIDVDTAKGRVALKGTAPTSAAREQATLLAQNVKGVVGVDNKLTVKQ